MFASGNRVILGPGATNRRARHSPNKRSIIGTLFNETNILYQDILFKIIFLTGGARRKKFKIRCSQKDFQFEKSADASNHGKHDVVGCWHHRLKPTWRMNVMCHSGHL